MSAVQPELPSFAGIHLTFDDGPDPEWTPRCLDVLAQANAKATFFMIGEKARAHPEIARRIAADGHQIGNHTLTHAHPWRLSASRARAEVRDGAVAIADVLGIAPKFFRPPHGRRRRCMLEQAEMQGERILMWDVSAIDWGLLGTSDRIAARLARVRDGQIVLMHDGRNRHNRPDQLLSVLPEFLSARALRKGDG
ncbi:MAG TPA: polysaccharide deacetylase family protein [Steroidobacteraceae bacterium]